MMSSHASTDRPTDKWVASQLVCNLLEAVHDLWKLKMSPEFVSTVKVHYMKPHAAICSS